MGRIAKIKRLLIEDANKRLLEQSDSEERIGNLESDILHLSNDNMDDIIEKIHKDEELKHSLSLTDHSDDTTIMDTLAHNVHAHYDPSSSHLSLQFPHLGKHHDIEIDIEGSWGSHHDSHDSYKFNMLPHVVLGAGIKIPLSHKSAH